MNQEKIRFVIISIDDLETIIEEKIRNVVGEMFERQHEYQQKLKQEDVAMLTQAELKELTGYGNTWIRDLEKRGILKNYKRPGTHKNLYKKSEVLDLMNRGVIRKKK